MSGAAASQVFEAERSGGVPRSAFDLSHEKKFTCDMGQVIPVLCQAAIPGDIFEISNSMVMRFQPMVAPILHQIDVEVFYFFDSYRLLDPNFEEFITRGILGTTSLTPPLFDPDLFTVPANVVTGGTLWDFLGFPLLIPPAAACPMDYPRRAYYHIWSEFFRDETLQTALDPAAYGTQHNILNACWKKDYFTSALPFQQRGTAPALPIFGSASVDFSGVGYENRAASDPNDFFWPVRDQTQTALFLGLSRGTGGNVTPVDSVTNFQNYWNAVEDGSLVDGSSFTATDIADFRLTAAMQVWMERNARGGARYVEVLKNQFRVSPTDSRLQRPEFIGATKNNVMISEVLQTSVTAATPQGNMAGHGIAIQSEFVSKYRVEEFGVIMGLMVVRPRPAYQDGINKQWTWRTAFDFPWPIFTGLSEQAITNKEICTLDQVADPAGTANNNVFGYTGRYNELRYQPDMVCSEMRSTFDYWHLGRQFNPAAPPALNAAFVECIPRKDIFAVPTVPGLIVSFGNHVKALRPLPFMPVPSTLGL